jgi:hypothetical protein
MESNQNTGHARGRDAVTAAQREQAEEIKQLRSDLDKAQVHLSLLAAGLLTVAERSGTSGWATMADLIQVMREGDGSEHDRAMARAGDIVARRVSPDSSGARFTDKAAKEASSAARPRRLSGDPVPGLMVHRGGGEGGPSSRGSLKLVG